MLRCWHCCEGSGPSRWNARLECSKGKDGMASGLKLFSGVARRGEQGSEGRFDGAKRRREEWSRITDRSLRLVDDRETTATICGREGEVAEILLIGRALSSKGALSGLLRRRLRAVTSERGETEECERVDG
eukprot:3118653-Pleurochrysis_carterae.AAC.2